MIIIGVDCRQPIPLPVERRWSYKPNELLWKAVRYYGLVPVIRTIRRLFDEPKVSFAITENMTIKVLSANFGDAWQAENCVTDSPGVGILFGIESLRDDP